MYQYRTHSNARMPVRWHTLTHARRACTCVFRVVQPCVPACLQHCAMLTIGAHQCMHSPTRVHTSVHMLVQQCAHSLTHAHISPDPQLHVLGLTCVCAPPHMPAHFHTPPHTPTHVITMSHTSAHTHTHTHPHPHIATCRAHTSAHTPTYHQALAHSCASV